MTGHRAAARRRCVDERGQSAVELALVMPLVMLLLLALAHVALIAHDQLTLEDMAREAARAAAVDDMPPVAARRAVERLAADRDISVDVEVSADTVTVVLSQRAGTAVPVIGTWAPSRTLTAQATMARER